MGNEIEKVPLKKRIIPGLIGGLAYAIIMAGYDLYIGEPFSLTKFVINTLLLGFLMSVVFSFKNPKKKK
ncbi:hypothetical protein GCM10008085_12950 [Winogradskyella epiphytica]|uniref:hypothetical protein n=1 Tax=Winogradskyella epiphytica TaxID=262005 RepID=UPI000D7D16E5|nr:hypothetical protein [Winogradskyella epiphytica]GGW62556.1 hypothetical protein GCM10008085_12950 [Winogradskyella epiphytica]